jgi:hypothetical protein
MLFRILSQLLSGALDYSLTEVTLQKFMAAVN